MAPASASPTGVAPAAPVPAPAPVAISAAEERDDEEPKKKKKKKDKGARAAGEGNAHEPEPEPGKAKDKDRAHPGEVRTAAGRLRLKGRVFAQAALQRQNVQVAEGANFVAKDQNSLDISIDSVRVGFEYQAPIKWITAVAEMELTSGVSLKDGFVQARDKHWSVRAGQFKMPVSAIEMESPWALPLVRRGLIHTLLTDWLDVAGRRPGVLVSYRTGAEPRLRLSAGAFQGGVIVDDILPGDRETDPIQRKSLDSQSLVGRADLELGSFAAGAWYEHRVGSPSFMAFEHYETLGLDLVVDHALPDGGIRAWVDALAGESWYEVPEQVTDGKDTWFFSARAIAAYRFGGAVDEAPYVEPFVFAGGMDPDLNVVSDLVLEGGVGVNAGYWRRVRLTLEAEWNSARRNLPTQPRTRSYVLENRDPDRLSLLAQAGVAW